MSNSDKSSLIRRRSPVPIDRCGAAVAAEIVADKWTLLIIREALYGVKRYDDMRRDIQIPRSVLTQRLKRLVEYGIMEREPYREDGARTRYAYVLSEKGKDLGLTLLALMQWGDKHLRGGASSISLVDAKTEKPLKVGLVGENAKTTPLEAAAIRPR